MHRRLMRVQSTVRMSPCGNGRVHGAGKTLPTPTLLTADLSKKPIAGTAAGSLACAPSHGRFFGLVGHPCTKTARGNTSSAQQIERGSLIFLTAAVTQEASGLRLISWQSGSPAAVNGA